MKECFICKATDNTPIKINNGIYYGLIKHHILPISKKGRDTKENRIILCEKCHREFHSKNGKLNYRLYY